jgi:hypothetical protein
MMVKLAQGRHPTSQITRICKASEKEVERRQREQLRAESRRPLLVDTSALERTSRAIDEREQERGVTLY